MVTIDALEKIQAQLQQKAAEQGQVFLVVKLVDGEGALVKSMDFPCPPNEVVKLEIYMPEAKNSVVSMYVAPESISRIEVWDQRPPGVDAMGPMGFEPAGQ